MDDEAAEIELLEQNLHKTRQISQRMVSILSSFDQRLGKLEKSILPLYNSTQLLTRRAANIEAALAKIDDVASNQEGIAAEEALILRGPQPGQLGIYQEALERLNASIAFNSSDRDARDTARLVETGSKKLAQMFTALAAEGSQGAGFPPHVLSALRPLVDFLRTLPTPPTHPSHPAAAVIQTSLRDAQRGYGEMRGAAIRRVLESGSKNVLEAAEGDGVAAGQTLERWLNDFLAYAEEEHRLLVAFAPLPDPAQIQQTYATLLNPPSMLLSSTLGSLTALVKRSLHRYTLLALGVMGALSSVQPRWEATAALRGSQRGDELRDANSALRSLALRSFPEFLADVKAAALGSAKGGDVGTSIADVTLSTVAYLERLPDVAGPAGVALRALGDGNWRMGEGVAVAKVPKLGEGDEGQILEHYVYDVVTTVLASLTTLARSSRRPAFGAIFLLNNAFYLNSRLIESSQTELIRLLAKPTRDALQSATRTAKAGYFDANFSPLMQNLADDRDKSKGGMKEKFTRFFDLLEEVVERHKHAHVLEDDEEARETIAEEVVKLVVPSFQRFTQRTKEKEFSKNPQKYIKMSAESVEAQIRSCYR